MEIIYRKFIVCSLLVFTIISFLFFFLLPTDLIKEADNDAHFMYMDKDHYLNANQDLKIRWDSSDTNIHFIINPIENVDIVAYSILGEMLSNDQYNVNIVNSITLLNNTYENSFEFIIDSFDEDAKYIMIVHSEDYATVYVNEHVDRFYGIVYLDSQPFVKVDDQLNVLCIYTDSYKVDKTLFPIETSYYKINGGISENYINLKYQLGKSEAIISRQEQQKLAVDEILSWVELYETE